MNKTSSRNKNVKSYWLSCCWLIYGGCLMAQSTTGIKLSFRVVSGSEVLNLTEPVSTVIDGDTMTIETFKCYISGIELWHQGTPVWKEDNSYHLLDAAESTTLQLALNTPENTVYDQLKFYLGIDSLTNAGGAKGGDLDPTRGMYWAWQSGYINFKLEGKSGHCPTRNQEFAFHLGGYLSPYNSLQTVVLETQKRNDMVIDIDVEQFLSGIDLSVQYQVMTPGNEAIILAEKASHVFRINQL